VLLAVVCCTSVSALGTQEEWNSSLENGEDIDVGGGENRTADVEERLPDIGLCIGIPEDKTPTHCRDHDADMYACNNICGCRWMPLPKCGDRGCLDLYTNDEDTTSLFLGIVAISSILVCCCIIGWVVVGCHCCARSRARYKLREEERKSLLETRKAEARNRGEEAAVDAEDVFDEIDLEIDVDSAGTPDLIKDDPEANIDDAATAGTDTETDSALGQRPPIVDVQMF